VIGVSVSSRRRFAWLADEFHATRHARSDGCVREVAFVVPANASADVRITAIDDRRAMGETLARRRGDANVACASVIQARVDAALRDSFCLSRPVESERVDPCCTSVVRWTH
jgi:hypothetical protein